MTQDAKAIAYPLIELLQSQADIDHPIAGRELCERFGLQSTGELREIVNWLRAKGDPVVSLIGSDQRGYYWIHDPNQAGPTLAQLLGRIRAIDDAYRGLKRACGRPEDQVELVL